MSSFSKNDIDHNPFVIEAATPEKRDYHSNNEQDINNHYENNEQDTPKETPTMRDHKEKKRSKSKKKSKEREAEAKRDSKEQEAPEPRFWIAPSRKGSQWSGQSE